MVEGRRRELFLTTSRELDGEPDSERKYRERGERVTSRELERFKKKVVDGDGVNSLTSSRAVRDGM